MLPAFRKDVHRAGRKAIDIKDQRHLPVAQDRRAGHAFDLVMRIGS
jgi:hypothetical protein